eukprot:7639564-Prorocentrum_lima.AAC.1
MDSTKEQWRRRLCPVMIQWLRSVAQDRGGDSASASIGMQRANDSWPVPIDALFIGTWRHL